MTFKEKIYLRYKEILNDKITSLQNILNDLRESASNETKSTAGDKHETALAMLQIEQANTSRQLSEALTQKAVFEKIDATITASQIVNGSLVKTTKGYLFVCIALGKMTVDDFSVIALSPQSPLGNKLLGLKVNDVAELNGIKYMIEAIE